MEAERLGDTSRRCELSFDIVLAPSFNVDKSSDIDSPGMIEKVSAMIVLEESCRKQVVSFVNRVCEREMQLSKR